MLATISGSAADAVKLGRIEAEDPKGAFIAAWRAAVRNAGVAIVDATRGIDNALAVKQPNELVRAYAALVYIRP